MKLPHIPIKQFIASLSAIGLISCPLIAAAHTNTMHHHHVKQTNYKDYKDMGAMAIPAACTMSQNAIIMTNMSQNMGRSLPNPCNPGWYNRIQISGGVNVDLGKFGNRNTNYMGENYQRVSLNDAYLNVAAEVNDWARAFASLSYSTASINANPLAFKIYGAAEYSAASSNNIFGTANNVIQLEQAYATIGNFDALPIFLQIGKQYQDFSRYEIHPITVSMTQVMSETLATSLKVGFIYRGFNGSIYAFDDPIRKVTGSSAPTTNGGIALGYEQPSNQMGWDIGAGLLYNMIGANDVAYQVVNFTKVNAYNSRVGAGALYADINSGPFTLGARYTAAATRFNAVDLPKNGVANLSGGTIAGTPTAAAGGAKPWAAGITGGYDFDTWGKNQNVYVGFQASRQSGGLDLPKSRMLVGYGIDVFNKNMVHVGVEWDHDIAYNVSNGGTGERSNLFSLRSSVKFS